MAPPLFLLDAFKLSGMSLPDLFRFENLSYLEKQNKKTKIEKRNHISG